MKTKFYDDCPEELPEAVQAIFNNLGEDDEQDTYKRCEEALKQCEALGFTFEYGLDGEPYELRKLTAHEWQERQQSALYKKHGAFFAFSNEQFYEQRKEGVKYAEAGLGLLCPADTIVQLVKELNELFEQYRRKDIEENGLERIIKRELYNYECFYVGDITEAVDTLSPYGITREQVQNVYNEELPKVDF